MVTVEAVLGTWQAFNQGMVSYLLSLILIVSQLNGSVACGASDTILVAIAHRTPSWARIDLLLLHLVEVSRLDNEALLDARSKAELAVF